MSKVEASLVAQSTDIHGEENFPQGCSFSPDGLCVLTSTAADSKLRLYNTPSEMPSVKEQQNSNHQLQDWRAVFNVNAGESVRHYAWYPRMRSNDPASCCFLAAARDQPAHLHDAYTGAVRATYCPYNALDEMESPTVVAFTPDCHKILAAGFRTDRTIHVFDIDIPGRDSTVLHLGKTRRSIDGQKGLVSAIAFGGSTNQQLLAVGTYSPGSIYVYDWRVRQPETGTVMNGSCVVGHGKGHARKKRRFVTPTADHDDSNTPDDPNSHWFSAAKAKWFQSKAQNGVTRLLFAPRQGHILYSASRRSNAIIAWDLRVLSGNPDFQSNPIHGFASFETNSDTNQRIDFDIDPTGQYLFVGGLDKRVRVYDTVTGALAWIIDHLKDAANGVSLAQEQPLLAVATGSRKFLSENDLEAEYTVCTNDSPGLLQIYKLVV
jgi:WD40 repeat protein